jgi:two-component system LytT family response regulator
MELSKFNFLKSRIKSNASLSAFWIGVYVIIILQDYLFSRIRDTGFYWPEVITYNVFWLLFIPLTLAANALLSSRLHTITRQTFKAGISLAFGVITALFHIILFVSFFTLVSRIFFNPPHPFINTLKATISNDLYFPVLVYFIVFMILSYKDKVLPSDQNKHQVQRTLKISSSGKIIHVPEANIICIGADKPYASVYTTDGKHLCNFSLQHLSYTLDKNNFRRVHKSWIINKEHIKELSSRKNGDYDAILTNEIKIRLSRHYRDHWKELLL